MRQILAFINQKGGCGKTTGVLGVALAASAETGTSAVVVDLDPQLSALNHVRLNQLPLIAVAGFSAVPADATLIFIDTPGLDLDVTKRAVQLATRLIIPCKPSLFDLRASALTVKYVQRARKSACWLPSMLDRRLAAHRHIDASLQHMMESGEYDWPILPGLGALSSQASYLNGEPGGPFAEQCATVWQALKGLAQ